MYSYKISNILKLRFTESEWINQIGDRVLDKTLAKNKIRKFMEEIDHPDYKLPLMYRKHPEGAFFTYRKARDIVISIGDDCIVYM